MKSIRIVRQAVVHVRKYEQILYRTSSIKFQTSLGNSSSFAIVKRLSTSNGVGLLLGVVLESTVQVPLAFIDLFIDASSPINTENLYGIIRFLRNLT
jgi:Na+-transporting NADH:ubiquinone oxidoreductase subunit NqrE